MTLEEDKQMDAEVFPFEDNYWVSRGSRKLLTYTGPPLKETLELQAVKRFAHKKGALGVMWNYGQDYSEEGPWYRCVCDTVDYDMDKIKSKNARHNLRRSLKRCTVRPVDYLWLSDNGYDVYVKAASRYKNFKVESNEQFRKRMHSNSTVPGSEAFGVFVDDKLVAYVTLFICGQSVRGDTAHFDPAYSSSYPMYALYYTITHHYLKERGYKELDRGSRPLMHETNIDNFLLRLGYRKAYCRLGLYLARPVRVVLSIARIFRKVYKPILPSRYYAALDGLLLAQDIARATSTRTNHV